MRLLRREAVGEAVAAVVAHPDDETIGLGALLPLFGNLLLVHVTDGAPRDGADARSAGCGDPAEYAATRERELAAALATGGVRASRASLGAADQGASADMAALAEGIAARLERHGTRLVLTHPYEGGHPDHDAAAWCVAAAVVLLARRGAAPAVWEMACYHAGPDGWAVGRFLPSGPPPTVVTLDAGERERKRAMLRCFATQSTTLARFPVGAESVRPAPFHNFSAAPHAGALLYERFPWGMDGPRWRGFAVEAGRALGLPP